MATNERSEFETAAITNSLTAETSADSDSTELAPTSADNEIREAGAVSPQPPPAGDAAADTPPAPSAGIQAEPSPAPVVGPQPPLTPAPAPEGDAPTVASARTIHYASLIFVVVYLLAALIFLFISMGKAGDGRDRAQAAAFGIGMVGVALLLLHFLDSTVGLFRPLISNGRFSTSLTQLGLWTIAAGTGFAYLLGLTIFGASALDDVMPAGTWDDYLILLGGPFAAAVLAKGIVTYKVENGMMQATTPQQSKLSQVATNEQGHVDLIDSQYLLFNVIALGYFVFKLLDTNTLPTMPGALLALTSSTAGLYVANKAAIKNAPTITSVSPRSVEAGKVLTIHGANFMPDGAIEGRVVSVSLTGHADAIYETLKATNTVVQVTVPEDTTPGWQQVEVTSTAAVATLPASVLVTAPQTSPLPSQIEAAPV